MSVMEVLLTIVVIVCTLSLLLNFLMYNHLVSMNIFVQQAHAGVTSSLNKLLVLEQVVSRMTRTMEELVDALDHFVGQFSMMSPGGKQMYRTMDGKYSAGTLEELVDKIKENNEEEKYFKDDDMDKLRSLFEEDDDLTENPDEEEDLF